MYGWSEYGVQGEFRVICARPGECDIVYSRLEARGDM